MSDATAFKATMTRLEKVLSERPSEGRSTKAVTAEIIEGLKCEIGDGKYSVISDHPPAVWGGGDAGPNPGFYTRTALAACLAHGYVLFCAQNDVPIERISVDVESDVNTASCFNVEGVPSGFTEMRIVVSIESPADPAAVQNAIEQADAGSIVLNTIRNPVPVTREIRLNQQRDAAE